jgi:hypothetical protein
MLRKILLLMTVFSCFVSHISYAVDNPYVMEVANTVSSQNKDVKVDVQQISESSKIICSYNVTNNSQKPIATFRVGENQLLFPPLNWLDRDNPGPELAPEGWFESLGENSENSTYSMFWQANTTEDLLQPNHSQDFKMEFQVKDKLECNKLDWKVGFAVVYPVIKADPTTLSITVTNLRLTPEKYFEGEVSIKNLGPNDTVLNLGTIFGDKSYADRLVLMARGANGQLQRIEFMEPLMVAGRVDPMVVQLPDQATYTIPGKWLALKPIIPGSYTFYVEFEGSVARTYNSDNTKINFLKYWLGKIDSNEVSLTIP